MAAYVLPLPSWIAPRLVAASYADHVLANYGNRMKLLGESRSPGVVSNSPLDVSYSSFFIVGKDKAAIARGLRSKSAQDVDYMFRATSDPQARMAAFYGKFNGDISKGFSALSTVKALVKSVGTEASFGDILFGSGLKALRSGGCYVVVAQESDFRSTDSSVIRLIGSGAVSGATIAGFVLNARVPVNLPNIKLPKFNLGRKMRLDDPGNNDGFETREIDSFIDETI